MLKKRNMVYSFSFHLNSASLVTFGTFGSFGKVFGKFWGGFCEVFGKFWGIVGEVFARFFNGFL